MEQHKRTRSLWYTFTRIFSWGWRSMEAVASISGIILLINGVLYASNAGGIPPDRILAAMSWMISPFLAVLDCILPPLAWVVRFASSIWNVSSLIAVISIIAGFIGMLSGTALFITEIFRNKTKGEKNDENQRLDL